MQNLSGSWCIKGTDESTLVMDSSVPLTRHNPDLASLILIQITPKERTQTVYGFLTFTVNSTAIGAASTEILTRRIYSNTHIMLRPV